MPKPFFYRIDAAEFVAAVLQIQDGQHKQWVTQLALDMVSGVGTMDFSKKIIEEVENYRKKQAEAGAKGGKPKHKQPYSDPIAGGNDTTTTPKQNIANSSSSSSSSSSTETTEEKEKTCPEPSDSEPAYQIILKDKTLFDVSEEQVDEWEQIYIGIDVRREFSKMVQWCVNNPKKRKTRDGCIKFICNWLGRDGEKRANENPTTTTHPTDLFDELVRDAANKNKRPVHSHEDDHAYQEPTPEQIKMQDEVWARMMGK